jgi:hypothetical protein
MPKIVTTATRKRRANQQTLNLTPILHPNHAAPSAPRVKSNRITGATVGPARRNVPGQPNTVGGFVGVRANSFTNAAAKAQTQAATPVTPAASSSPPAATTPAPTPPVDVRDSGYYGWLAQRQGEVNQQQIAWDAEEAGDTSARTEALRRLAQQRPENLLAADRSANRAGLFYSGALGKQRGDIEADYVRTVGDTNATYQRAHDAREAARQALLSGFSVEQAAQMAAAADRAAERDQALAESGSLAGPDSVDASVAASQGSALARAGTRPGSAPPGTPTRYGIPIVQPKKGANILRADALRRKALAKKRAGQATIPIRPRSR